MAADFIFVLTGNRYRKVTLSSLLYLRSGPGGTELIMSEETLVTRADLSRFERLLSSCLFCRVHADYLVAINQIISFDHSSVQLPGVCLPVERPFLPGLIGRVRILNISSHFPEDVSLAVDAGGRLILV